MVCNINEAASSEKVIECSIGKITVTANGDASSTESRAESAIANGYIPPRYTEQPQFIQAPFQPAYGVAANPVKGKLGKKGLASRLLPVAGFVGALVILLVIVL